MKTVYWVFFWCAIIFFPKKIKYIHKNNSIGHISEHIQTYLCVFYEFKHNILICIHCFMCKSGPLVSMIVFYLFNILILCITL